MFLGRYKLMLGSDSKRIYKTKDYHRKKLKVLEKERYIKRVNKLYIKLDDKGTKLVKEFGYEYNCFCRNKEYMERMKEIAKIAGLTIDSSIEFTPSWNLKDSSEHTNRGRKYLGKMIYQGKEIFVYYIAKDKQRSYISRIINDIDKLLDNKNVIVFIEDMDILNDNRKFIFGKTSTVIIKPTIRNLQILQELERVESYEIIKRIYPKKEILLSNWGKAEYMTEDKEYIMLMPFIDTEKLHELNIFMQNNPKLDRKINIITLEENKEEIEKILIKEVSIIKLDDWLGGINEE